MPPFQVPLDVLESLGRAVDASWQQAASAGFGDALGKDARNTVSLVLAAHADAVAVLGSLAAEGEHYQSLLEAHEHELRSG